MKTKIGVTAVALSLVATALVGFASAVPTLTSNPPTMDNSACTHSTVGSDGDATGTSGAAVSPNTYHVYQNTQGFQGIWDGCMNVPDLVGFALCAQGEIGDGIDDALLYLLALDPLTALGLLLEEVLNMLFGQSCGGIANTGSDGEYEFGDAAGAINVRTGATGATDTPANAGSGTDVCINSASTDHHGADSTIYVLDAVAGGNVGFWVSADWGRGATISQSGDNENTNAAFAPWCGDGAVEPCPAGTPGEGLMGEATYIAKNEAPSGSTPPFVPPTSSAELGADLLWYNGCNNLDKEEYKAPAGVGSTGPNAWSPSAGGTLRDFGEGGAQGWLLVILQDPSVSIVPWDLTPSVTPSATASTPVAGWIWTG